MESSLDTWVNERMNSEESKDSWPNERMNSQASKDDWANEKMNDENPRILGQTRGWMIKIQGFLVQRGMNSQAAKDASFEHSLYKTDNL